MGSHIGFYKVLDKPSFDIEELKEKYLKLLQEEDSEFNPPWNKLDPNYPFYYQYENTKEPLTKEKVRDYYSWFREAQDHYCFRGDDLYGTIFTLKGNPLLYQFKDKAFQIPCVQYKGRQKKLVKTFPQFLEFEEVGCPWVRIFPYGATFITKENFLKYLKTKTLPQTKLEADRYGSWHLSNLVHEECADFFSKNFVNGEHLIQLG